MRLRLTSSLFCTHQSSLLWSVIEFSLYCNVYIFLFYDCFSWYKSLVTLVQHGLSNF